MPLPTFTGAKPVILAAVCLAALLGGCSSRDTDLAEKLAAAEAAAQRAESAADRAEIAAKRAPADAAAQAQADLEEAEPEDHQDHDAQQDGEPSNVNS